MLLGVAVGAIIIAGGSLAWGVVTEFRQSRRPGPKAVVPTYPFAVQSALLLAAGLLILRRALAGSFPLLLCLGAGLAIGLLGVTLINIAARIGRTHAAQHGVAADGASPRR